MILKSHVKGHQRESKGQQLTLEVQLNNRADALTGKAYSLPQLKSRPIILTAKATLIINNMEAASTIDVTLHQTHKFQNMQEYFQNKCQWGNTVNDIDWTVHNMALSKLPHRKQTTIIKYIHEWLPTITHHSRLH